MHTFRPLLPPVPLALTLLAALAAPGAAGAQVAQPELRVELEGQFETAARKVVGLARAMPAETYDWRPMDGVASVASAYMHIARYNYMYPEQNLGVAAPEGITYGDWEETVEEKERVVELLAGSMDHVREVLDGMSDEELAAPTTLYGRSVPRWAVILQLVTHMSEHLGQQIAYARMNGVAPPWSR